MSIIENQNKETGVRQPRIGSLKIFLIADACYLLLVFGWMPGMTPLGRDFGMLARPDNLGGATGWTLSLMTGLFNDWAPAYLLANLVLLYGSMALLLVLTRLLTQGPWWLGSIAAVLFMANPVKTEAVLSFAGVGDLMACFLSLLVLLVYAYYGDKDNVPGRYLSLMVYLATIMICPDTIPLFLVIVLLEVCFFRNRPGGVRRFAPLVITGLIAWLISGQWAMENAFSPAAMFIPLFLILYPIGMLPGNIAVFHDVPVLGYVCGAGLVLTVLVLLLRARNPIFTFGVMAAVAFRFLHGAQGVDPATLAGGGKLLFPVALLTLAAAGGFRALMDHPHWRRSVVRLSTLLCIAAMICQGWVNWHWLQASRLVRHFQQAAQETVSRHPGQPVALVPDLQYVGTAPVLLSQSVRYDTPFSRILPVLPLMPVSVMPPAEIELVAYSNQGFQVTVNNPVSPLPERPPLFSRTWWKQRYRPPEQVLLEMHADEHPFPEIPIPGY